MAQSAPEDGKLAQLLAETADVLTGLRSASTLANVSQYKNLHQRLEQLLASDNDSGVLSDANRRHMAQSMDVMFIARRLAPGSETNAGIRYCLANT